MSASYELDGPVQLARHQLQTLNNQLSTSSQSLEQELQKARSAAELKIQKLSSAMKNVQRRLARKELRAQRKADERNEDIGRLKLAIQNRLNARLFRLCPISALPEETLFEIFDVLVATLDMSPTVLWLVCKRWRRIVQSCGSLWRFIKLEYNPHRRISVKGKYTCCSDESVLQLALTRARKAFLHVLLSLHSLINCKLQNDAVKLLFSDQVAYRIQTLDLSDSCSYHPHVLGAVGYFDRVSTVHPEPLLKTRHDAEGFRITALSSLKTLAFDLLVDVPLWNAISCSISRTSTLLQSLVLRSPHGLDLLPDDLAIRMRHLVYGGPEDRWVTRSFARFQNLQTLRLEDAYSVFDTLEPPTLKFPMLTFAFVSLIPAYLVKGWGLSSLYELDIHITDIVDPTVSVPLPLLQILNLRGCASILRQSLIHAPRLQTLRLCVKDLNCGCCGLDEDGLDEDGMKDKEGIDIKAILTYLNASRLQSCRLDFQRCDFVVETQLLLLAIQEMEELTSLTVAVREMYHIRPLLMTLNIPTRGPDGGWRPLLCPLLQRFTLDVISTPGRGARKLSDDVDLFARGIFEARRSMEAPLRCVFVKCVYKNSRTETEDDTADGYETRPVEASVRISTV
jgi:hypothetical protein